MKTQEGETKRRHCGCWGERMPWPKEYFELEPPHDSTPLGNIDEGAALIRRGYVPVTGGLRSSRQVVIE